MTKVHPGGNFLCKFVEMLTNLYKNQLNFYEFV